MSVVVVKIEVVILPPGGNSRTAMIAALSPADINYEETLSTLRSDLELVSYLTLIAMTILLT